MIKEKVRQGALRLLVGTNAAPEGLNLQRLGTLINLDLPWNPTRLESVGQVIQADDGGGRRSHDV